MSYFETNYPNIVYPVGSNNTVGLYNAQLGAIHAIASYFTMDNDPALIVMPTGSGKTAVLMMAPFILRSKRVLVLTPSRMVRNQIAADAQNLKTLKKVGILPDNIELPKVKEVANRVLNWDELREYDFVISTPQCVSQHFDEIPPPPDGMFDLVLVDEAHHSPAKTWASTINSINNAKKILFTATPFRRDKKEIKGKYVYSYPLALAYQDNIYSNIEYIPINIVNNNADISIAVKAEQILNDDRRSGYKHYLMVRTDSIKRAEQLSSIYSSHTGLRLRLICSRHSSRYIQQVINNLKSNDLDGIICVNMLGEGFDFPNLKIAAIHSPHKSLEVTLQFIGRFARVRGENIGQAKFIAEPSEIEVEGNKLFQENATWKDIITNMTDIKVSAEIEANRVLQDFTRPEITEEALRDLSLYSIWPRQHIKIYQTTENINLNARINFNSNYDIVFKQINNSNNTSVFVLRECILPRWSKIDKLLNINYELVVIYYNEERSKLFINSSTSVDSLYKNLLNIIDPGASEIPSSFIRKVMTGLININCFNLGLKNTTGSNNTESYRIMAGSSTQTALSDSDSRLYRQGHIFVAGEEAGKRVTIGYSTASKVWGSKSMRIGDLIAWCNSVAEKIDSNEEVNTNSNLDRIDAGEIVHSIPIGVISADWNKEAYDYLNPIEVKYISGDGSETSCLLAELDISINHEETNENQIILNIEGEELSYPLKFSLSDFFKPLEGNNTIVKVGDQPLFEYMNDSRIVFRIADSSMLINNELFKQSAIEYDVNDGLFEIKDWTNVDITNECEQSLGENNISIQDYIKNKLIDDQQFNIIFYDHGTGEMADYVAMKEIDNKIIIQLIHCKKSSGAIPGARVADVYEICGQSLKSLNWSINLDKFNAKFLRRCRKKPECFLRGDINQFQTIINDAKTKERRFEIIAVQPGISKNQITGNISKSLGATNERIIKSGHIFKVFVSS